MFGVSQVNVAILADEIMSGNAGLRRLKYMALGNGDDGESHHCR